MAHNQITRAQEKEQNSKIDTLLEMLSEKNPEQTKFRTLNVFGTFVKIGFAKGELLDCVTALVTAIVMYLGAFVAEDECGIDSFIFLIEEADNCSSRGNNILDILFRAETARNSTSPPVEYLRLFLQFKPEDRRDAVKLVRILNPELFTGKAQSKQIK